MPSAVQRASYSERILRSPTSIVYLEYDPATLKPVPSPEWTRFVCISDTHARNFDVPPGDVLLHTGDLTNIGLLDEFQKTMEWLYRLPHKKKIIIAGNHDLSLHTGWYDENYKRWHSDVGKQPIEPIMDLLKGSRAVEAGIVYLEDEQHSFQAKEGGKTWSVYGSPWSPVFFNWAFNYEKDQADELVSKFPKTDILLTHGPAFEIFDRINKGINVGCESLAARLPELRPRLHAAGHIHEAHGAYIHPWDPVSDFQPPRIQNNNNGSANESDDEYEYGSEDNGSDGNSVEGLNVSASLETAEEESHITEPVAPVLLPRDLDNTVFVNAANWPSGRNAWRPRDSRHRVPFGGPGFQAVVVDLKE